MTMRVLSLIAVMGAMLASSANAACRRPSEHSPSAWATSIVRRASVIMVAQVTQQQDAQLGKSAVLRPIKIYRGETEEAYTMALPQSNDMIITEAYSGFWMKVGERRFVILYKDDHGYKTSTCDEVLVADPAIKAAVIRTAGY